MSKKFKLMMLASLAVSTSLSWGQAQNASPNSPSPAPTSAPIQLRPELAKTLSQAQKLLQEKQYAATLELLRTTDVLADKSKGEVYYLEQLRASAAQGIGNQEVMVKAIDAVLETGFAPLVQQVSLKKIRVSGYYSLGQYEQAVRAAKIALDAGVSSADMTPILAQSLYNLGQVAEAASLIRTLVDSQIAGGQEPVENQLKFMARAYRQAKNNEAYTDALELLVRYYPQPDYWIDLLARLANQSNLPGGISLDLLRLQWSLGLIEDPSDYLLLAELAIKEGQPAEALAALSDGKAKNVVGQGQDAADFEKLRQLAQKQTDEDKKNRATLTKGLEGKSASVWTRAGYNLIYLGDVPQGMGALQKARELDAGKTPELALRYANAQWLWGDKAIAHATYKDILKAEAASSVVKGMARLWMLRP